MQINCRPWQISTIYMHSVNQEFKCYKNLYFSKGFLWYNIFHSIKRTPSPITKALSFISVSVCIFRMFTHMHSPHKTHSLCPTSRGLPFFECGRRAWSQHTSPVLPGIELRGRAKSQFDPYHVWDWPLSGGLVGRPAPVWVDTIPSTEAAVWAAVKPCSQTPSRKEGT